MTSHCSRDQLPNRRQAPRRVQCSIYASVTGAFLLRGEGIGSSREPEKRLGEQVISMPAKRFVCIVTMLS